MRRPFFVSLALCVAAAMATFGLTQPPSHGAPPGVSVSPAKANPGATVRVSGSGFAGDCGVLVYWGDKEGLALGGGDVRKDGTYSVSVKLPTEVAAGKGQLSVVGRGYGQAGCAADSGKSAAGSVTVARDASPYGHAVALSHRLSNSRGVSAKVVDAAAGSSNGVHAIVQLHRSPGKGHLVQLRALGVSPVAYLSSTDGIGTGYVARMKPGFSASAARFKQLVRTVVPLTAADKIDMGLAFGPERSSYPVKVQFWTDAAASARSSALSDAGVEATRTSGQVVSARASLAQVKQLAAADAVQFIGLASKPGQYDLDDSRTLSNVDAVQQFNVASATYLGLSGLGVQLSIHDSGVDDHHNDFNGRMIRTNHPGAGGDHGTHVAGIAAGSGVMSNQNNAGGMNNGGTPFQWRGMAPQAGISAFDSLTGDDVGTMDDAIVDDGVDVSNHSYSYNDGEYNSEMVNIDTIIRGDAGIPARQQTFSAGNQGQAPQYGMNSGYFSLSKSCKNCLIVANLQDNGALAGGSSHGPTPDGRLKPEVGANGTTVISTGADVDNGDGGDDTEDSYRSKGGTSMATPAVTGITALMLQQYAEQYGVDLDITAPLPSTLRAILVQTAVDQVGSASGTNPDTGAATAYGAGPDWGTGYGSVDALAAVTLIEDELFLEDAVAEDDATDEHLASVVPGQDELKVTLSWDDLPGTPNSNHATPMLVNDLDLLLIGPNGEVVQPLVLPPVSQFDCDGDSSNGTQTGTCTPGADPGPWGGVAAPGIDRLNNTEQVVVPNPAPGIWRARVSVLNTDSTLRLPLGGTQSYSLAGIGAQTADLQVTKSDSPDPATAGDQLFYTVSVHNNGPDDATDVVVVDELPEGVAYVTNDLPGGCVEDPAGTLTCQVGDIKAGATKSFKIKVHVDPDLVSSNGEPLTIFNTASAWSTTVDPDLDNNTDTEGTIVEDLADLAVAKICKPDRPLEAGEQGHCTIFVDNHGPSFARDVRMENVVLSDQSFTISNVTTSQGSCSPVAPVAGGQSFVCNLGDLENASSSDTGRATIFYEISALEEADINDKASVSSDTPDPNDTNDTATEHVAVTAVADLSIDKQGPANEIAGTDATYTLTIENGGPSTAKGVVVTDNVPAGVEILSVSGSGGATCNAGTPGVAALPTKCSFGNLAPGESRTMTIEVRVLPDTRGVIHNDARVSSDTFDDDLSNNLDTVPTDVAGSADVSVTKTASPEPVVAGDPLTYTIVVTNGGPSTATDVKIEDSIPDGTSFVSGVDGNGGTVCALLQPGEVVCELGDLAPGETATVYLTVLVAPDVPDGTVLHNTVTVSSTTPDPNPGNNTDTEDTDVVTSAELWLDKQGELRSGNPAPMVVYTIVVHNDEGCETDAQSTTTPNCGDGGPSDAQDIVVTDQLPLTAKKLVVQFVSPQCTYTKATHSLTCTVPTLPAGQSVSFVVEAQISGSVGLVTNTATIASSATPDPVAANNTNTVTLVHKGGTGKKGG